ncbi:Sds, partial [Symbiodinium natans]
MPSSEATACKTVPLLQLRRGFGSGTMFGHLGPCARHVPFAHAVVLDHLLGMPQLWPVLEALLKNRLSDQQGPPLEDFLHQRVSRSRAAGELLWRHRARQGRLQEASEVLLLIAESKNECSLEERVRYLDQARQAPGCSFTVSFLLAISRKKASASQEAFLTAGCTCAALQASRSTCRAFAAGAAAPHIQTPLIYSEAFSKRLGAEVFLKLDLLQPSGSFKLRGIGETVLEAKRNGASCIVSSSGGNAGLAAAFAARACGLPCTVVLPSSTPALIRDRLAGYGAEVLVHGSVWDEADQHARKVVEEQRGAYVHPFDQESTWRGHSTIVQELQSQLPAPPDAIVTCVGGGGLLMGILQGVEAAGWSDTRVVACETQGASCLAQSLAKDELVTLPAITSVAKSLGALRPSEAVFERCRQLPRARFASKVFSDAQALAACVRLADEHRLVVEPACGAALAAVTERCESLKGLQKVVVEICGGAVVDAAQLGDWAKQVQTELLDQSVARLDTAARVQLPLQREMDLLILDKRVSERWRASARQKRQSLEDGIWKLQDLYQLAVDFSFYHLVLIIADLSSTIQ